jgi:hypothetical protein
LYDDNESSKIDEEVHKMLNLLVSSSMSLNDDPIKKSFELGAYPIFALDVVPLASYPPFAYTNQYWDANDLL